MTRTRRDPTEAVARGQVDPLVALPALAVLCIGLSLYAVVLGGTVHVTDRNVAEPTLDEVADEVTVAGVADPSRLPTARRAGPTGFHTTITIEASDRRWTAGQAPPETADTASRSVAVRLGPGTIRAGTIRVAVWPGEDRG